MSNNYDSTAEITDVTLKIHAASHNSAPKLYANGRNQLPIEIIASATGAGQKKLRFPMQTWQKMLNLCFAVSDENLKKDGNNGWCFTDKDNEYSKEPVFSAQQESAHNASGENDDGTVILLLYVYTYEQNTKRIAVNLDTDAGNPGNKHFTTADNSTGAEKMSVQVNSINPILYRQKDLNIVPVYGLGEAKAKVHYDITLHTPDSSNSSSFDRNFSCHYDNYYINLGNNNKIIKANIHDYGDDSGSYKRMVAYDSNHNNQHMIVVHPFNCGTQQEEFGFDNTVNWFSSGLGYSIRGSGTFYLRQKITYGDKPDHLCLTQLAFHSGEAWELPDGKGLDIAAFKHNAWFELYDEYGNYGKFSIKFSGDNSFIEIKDL